MTLTGVSENDDRTVNDVGTGTNARFAAGSASGLTTQTNRTIAVSSSANFEGLVAVSWA
jgi:hypothetical protein